MKKSDKNNEQKNSSNTWTIIFAILHSYGWLPIVILFLWLPVGTYYWLGIFCILQAIWILLGYELKWKHIYCAYQHACHEAMTPDHIVWNKVKKIYVYGRSALFLLAGVVVMVISILVRPSMVK